MNEALQYSLSQEQALVGKAANVQREDTGVFHPDQYNFIIAFMSINEYSTSTCILY